jgi:hypothetical protein
MKSNKATVHNSPFTYVRGETSLFNDPGYDVTRLATQIQSVFPVTTIQDRLAPIQFYIKSNDTQYIDLGATKLKLKVRILADKGQLIKDGENVAPANNFLHSLFSQASCYFNETLVTPQSNAYPYKSYLETLLSYGKEYKKSQLSCSLFTREEDPTSTDEGNKDGYSKRYLRAKDSAVFELIGKPFVDVCARTCYLLPGVDVRFVFTRSTDEFALITPTDKKYSIEIQEAKLLVEKVTLLPSLALEHIRELEKGKLVCMPLRRVEVRQFTIAPGVHSVTNETLLSGLIPYRIICTLIDSKSFIGDMQTNPFNFSHHNLQYIHLSANGETVNAPLDLDYEKNLYLEAYDGLFKGLDINSEDVGLDITFEQFKKSFALYVFNIAQVR